MLATKANPSNLPSVDEAVPTSADTESLVSREPNDKRRDAWQKFIDQRLSNWLNDPAQLEDAGVEPPSGTIVRLALDYAERFRDDEMPPPDSVVPDANGGIVFERREQEISEVFHIWDDGTVEYQMFHGGRLIERQPGHLG